MPVLSGLNGDFEGAGVSFAALTTGGLDAAGAGVMGLVVAIGFAGAAATGFAAVEVAVEVEGDFDGATPKDGFPKGLNALVLLAPAGLALVKASSEDELPSVFAAASLLAPKRLSISMFGLVSSEKSDGLPTS
jgi:hypothetical protein